MKSTYTKHINLHKTIAMTILNEYSKMLVAEAAYFIIINETSPPLGDIIYFILFAIIKSNMRAQLIFWLAAAL